VRGSTEDFGVMFQTSDPDEVYNDRIAAFTDNFIYTQGAGPVMLYTGNGLKRDFHTSNGLKKLYPVQPTESIVSTIGAGDNFNAGFVYGLIRYGITRQEIEQGLSGQQWDDIIACALQFSANVCQSINNSVDPAFGQQMAARLK